MRAILELSIHFVVTLTQLLRSRGVKVVMAENLVMKQQLVALNRRRSRSPRLTMFDRIFFGLLGGILCEKRLNRIAVVLKPATILKFHKALAQRKYSKLYSNKTKAKPGRKSPDQALINLIIEMRNRNPLVGYGRISMQIYQAFGIEISRFAVGRILRKHFDTSNPVNGPSWLTFIGHMKGIKLLPAFSAYSPSLAKIVSGASISFDVILFR